MKRIKSRNSYKLQVGDEIIITQLSGRDGNYTNRTLSPQLPLKVWITFVCDDFVEMRIYEEPHAQSWGLYNGFTYIKEVQQ